MAWGDEQVGSVYEAGVGHASSVIIVLPLNVSPYRVEGLAEMAAVGLGLPASTFKEAGTYG